METIHWHTISLCSLSIAVEMPGLQLSFAASLYQKEVFWLKKKYIYQSEVGMCKETFVVFVWVDRRRGVHM